MNTYDMALTTVLIPDALKMPWSPTERSLSKLEEKPKYQLQEEKMNFWRIKYKIQIKKIKKKRTWKLHVVVSKIQHIT